MVAPSKRLWIPHLGDTPHEASPSGYAYIVQMRIPETERTSEYLALSDFTTDYRQALRWLHQIREKAGRHLMATKLDPLK